MKEIKVLPQQTEMGLVYHVYSSDLREFHGDYYTISDLVGKLTALRHQVVECEA